MIIDKNNKPTRYYSRQQEKAVAKALSGKCVSNSGATRFDKGDIKLPQWLIECKTKTCDSQSISIKKEWLEKMREESFAMRKPYSALAFNFGPNTENYYVIDESSFKLLVSYLESLE